MTKAERTRQYIIEKSAPIFNIEGYEGTSLSDIQKATKLTKGAIYGNFSDKNELILAAYEYNCSLASAHLNSAIGVALTASEALFAYIGFFSQNWQALSVRGGCPMLNAAVEADDHLDFMRENVRKSMKHAIKRLQDIIEWGQINNEFKSGIDAEKYAVVMFSIIEGNILLAKIMNTPKYLETAAERIALIIEQELIE